MLRERLPGPLARTGNHVEHARRQASLVHDLRDPEGGERGGIRRLRYHDVSRDKCRTELIAEQRSREVPGHDGPYDAQGAPHYQAVGVLIQIGYVAPADVLGEPRVVLEGVHEPPYLQARLAQGLALLGG